MNCSDCGRAIPYIAHEADMSRLERTIKRLWILCLVLIVLFVGTNIGWLVYESQLEEISSSEEVQQEQHKLYGEN